MNLYEQQTANRRRTWLIMFAFVALLFVLGLGFDLYFFGGEGYAPLPIGSLAALGIGSVSALVSYFSGARAVLAATGAVPIERAAAESDADKLELRQFENIVDEMAIASGLPRPAVYVVPDEDLNAFATGRGPEHASIAVTRGLLRTLNREELQGVVAHEMSHIKNLDIRVMTIVAALVGAIALLSDWSSRGMRLGGSRRSSKGKNGGGAIGLVFLVIWIAAALLAPFMAQALAMMVSRRREYLADASGAELTRNPMGLARALGKIESAASPTVAIKRGSAHLCITDPLGRRVNLKEGFWSDLFASHPPMSARISALEQMAFEGAGKIP